MNRSGDQPAAAERSRWLAELAQTVDQAQRLARTLGVPDGNCDPAKELYDRLERVRIEVEALRCAASGANPIQIDPLWTNHFPWNRRRTF